MKKMNNDADMLRDEAANKKAADHLGISYPEYQQYGGRIERSEREPYEYTVYLNDDLPMALLSKIRGIDTMRNFVVLPDGFFDK